MKKTIILLSLLFVGINLTFAQKIGYVDTEYILSKIPAYQDAQKSLDEYSQQWQQEIEQKFKDVGDMYEKYQQDKVLMSEEMKKQKQQQIIDAEREAKKLQDKYFGKEGDLFQKRQELVKPIQDNVFNSIKEVAEAGNYDYIFDKITGDILFSNDKYNESDEVLKKLGY